jgi:hypothetical protein
MSVSASVVDRHPAGRGASVDVRDAGTATRALARVEARRLLVHPAVLTMCGVLVLFFWMQPLVTGSVHRFPVLHQFDAEQHIAMLLLGVGVMIAANLAVLRSHRHNADVFFTVTVLPPWRRTLAHLLALLPVTAVAGIIELAGFALLAVQSGAVGRPDPLILAAGPLLVTLFGACGVLLARLIRSAVVAPLAVALVVFFWLSASHDRLPYRLAKLSPTFTGDTPTGGAAGAGAARPSRRGPSGLPARTGRPGGGRGAAPHRRTTHIRCGRRPHRHHGHACRGHRTIRRAIG